jgi:hypothetical protein
MPIKGHTHDLEAMERASETWCDDATAHRISNLAKKIQEELSGVHSEFRRTEMIKMVTKKIKGPI